LGTVLELKTHLELIKTVHTRPIAYAKVKAIHVATKKVKTTKIA
jgi:hypothetical protein